MDKGGLSLSAGPFIKGPEYATETNAYLIGKPSLLFFNSALSSLGKAPQETLMVGDDIITDIGDAKNAGISGALVRTGKFRDDKLVPSGIKPDFTLNSVSNLPEILGLK